jgi:hypothetical protein
MVTPHFLADQCTSLRVILVAMDLEATFASKVVIPSMAHMAGKLKLLAVSPAQNLEVR